MFTITINGPLLQVFEGGWWGATFLAVGFKGEATLPLSMRGFLFCICQITPKVAKSPFLNKFFVGLYFQLTLLSRQKAPNFNLIEY